MKLSCVSVMFTIVQATSLTVTVAPKRPPAPLMVTNAPDLYVVMLGKVIVVVPD